MGSCAVVIGKVDSSNDAEVFLPRCAPLSVWIWLGMKNINV